MTTLISSEWRKLLTTRMWWLLLGIMVVTVAAFSGLFGFALSAEGATGTGDDAIVLDSRTIALTVYTLGVSLGYVFPVTLGALHVTGEFRHGTIDTTLLASPNRGRAIAAKIISVVPMGFLYGIASMAAGLGAGIIALAITGQPLELGDAQIWRSLALGVVALAAWMVVGVGFGSVLTNQVAAIVTLLAFTQFVEPILRMVLGAWSATQGIGKFLPGAAGESIVGASFYSASGMGGLLPAWGGLLVLMAYALITALLGRLTTFRRDLT